ncbi:MAG: hypothetical protein ACKVUT_03815 [Gaiella sp.]
MTQLSLTRIARTLSGVRRSENGFSLIEAVLAMTIFVSVSAALGAILTSAITTNRLTKERTIAQQLATDKIEQVRRLGYEDVGTVSGNPPGTVTPIDTVSKAGFDGTVNTSVVFVADPTPTSYAQSANYKKITVSVRNTKGRTIAREVTIVAPDERAPYGGLNWVAINPTIVDYATNVPLDGVTVATANGPSPNRSDVTDTTGEVTFEALDPNNTSPADFYDLSATKSGYVLLANSTATHLSLSAGQTATPTLQMYRPAQADLSFVDSGGSPYSGAVTIRIQSGLTGTSFLYTTSSSTFTITDLGGVPLVPNVNYTIDGFSGGATPLCADDVSTYVPDDYAGGDLTSAITLTFNTCPVGTVVATATASGSPISGLNVTIQGGPYPMSPISGTTNGSGVVTFVNIPEGNGYTVSATYSSQNANAPADVVATQTTNVALPFTAYGTVTILVRRNGSPLTNGNGSARITGGPSSINITGTTDASGYVTFTNVPTGSGYTYKAWRSSCSGSTNKSRTNTSQTVASGSNNLTMDLNVATCPP